MRFEDLPLIGSRLIHGEPSSDQRGYFERIWCLDEFSLAGIGVSFCQSSVSWNEVAGTRRGLHFQTDDHSECKLVRCMAGSLYDVIVDVRPKSQTYGKWYAVELSAQDHRSLFIPEGFAHGFQTLVDDTTVLYYISKPYSASHARGIATDDPDLAIAWPCRPMRISDADRRWPRFSDLTLDRN